MDQNQRNLGRRKHYSGGYKKIQKEKVNRTNKKNSKRKSESHKQ
jgi:hypothetical protein